MTRPVQLVPKDDARRENVLGILDGVRAEVVANGAVAVAVVIVTRSGDDHVTGIGVDGHQLALLGGIEMLRHELLLGITEEK